MGLGLGLGLVLVLVLVPFEGGCIVGIEGMEDMLLTDTVWFHRDEGIEKETKGCDRAWKEPGTCR